MRSQKERATTFQTQAVVAAIGCNVDWETVSQFEAARFMDDSMKGDLSTAFVKSGRQVFFGELTRLPINRSQPYDPSTYPSNVWSIREEDERSLALTEIDPSEIKLVSYLRAVDGNDPISGEENLVRLKEQETIGTVRLDARIHQMFWRNKHRIPEVWKEKIAKGYPPSIHFDGTVLIAGGAPMSLLLRWNDRKEEWERDFRMFSHGRAPWMLSAVLY
ncbi:MAG: hypothetical protein A3C35_05790 [Omnitrophica bacterium RIFCSPHIGHO2_02_FULL_46_11]|nr:MAG: hypothetical protein A3C35_05790 [Omnitrophica bacterium RIFCSPHIGHO2_02_FULL_46_11]